MTPEEERIAAENDVFCLHELMDRVECCRMMVEEMLDNHLASGPYRAKIRAVQDSLHDLYKDVSDQRERVGK